ncbi:12678_t:CDS:2 [Acaulospora morrowiae]|uniref:12678_t:CDS:1 n=1 Tax=Acaulospora morrowiae TaxID=94023 RepID=A0A9N8VFD9_9GLOM|nr:12678_t:CDS:2 [Acaulospora morrowiae]
MALRFFEKLSADFSKLLDNCESYDVIVEVGEAPLNKTYKLHSLVLGTRCSLFDRELKEIKDCDSIKKLRKSDIAIDVFEIILNKMDPSYSISSAVLPPRNIINAVFPNRENDNEDATVAVDENEDVDEQLDSGRYDNFENLISHID